MKRHVLFVAAVTAVVVLAGIAPAFAQAKNRGSGIRDQGSAINTSAGEYPQRHVATVGFPFMIGGKQLPAGKYAIEQPTSELLIFQEEKSGAARIEVPVVTRLAAPATPLAQSKLIFDKVGTTYYLSEVWFRNQDGFLLYGSKEAHTHQAVKAEPKKK